MAVDRERARAADLVLVDLVATLGGESAYELYGLAQHAVVFLVAGNKDVDDVLVVDVSELLGVVRDVARGVRLGLVVLDPDLDVEHGLESPELPRSEVALDDTALGERRFATACDSAHDAVREPTLASPLSYLDPPLTADASNLNSRPLHG